MTSASRNVPATRGRSRLASGLVRSISGRVDTPAPPGAATASRRRGAMVLEGPAFTCWQLARQSSKPWWVRPARPRGGAGNRPLPMVPSYVHRPPAVAPRDVSRPVPLHPCAILPVPPRSTSESQSSDLTAAGPNLCDRRRTRKARRCRLANSGERTTVPFTQSLTLL